MLIGRYLDIEMMGQLVLHTKQSQKHTMTDIYELLVISFLRRSEKPRKKVSAHMEKITVCSDTIILSFQTYNEKNINMSHNWKNKKLIYINNYVCNFRLISDL